MYKRQALGAADVAEGGGQRLELILFGDCDVHMETDFLRKEAAGRGIDLRVAATFPDDLRLAGEHRHDAILIGALRARHAIADAMASGDGAPPFALFIAQARQIIEGLRAETAAPILIDNLPEPTVQPLGMAERGQWGHRNRFRLANVALAELAESYADVHVVCLLYTSPHRYVGVDIEGLVEVVVVFRANEVLLRQPVHIPHHPRNPCRLGRVHGDPGQVFGA